MSVEPRKPNRAERRRVASISAKMNRANSKKSLLRSKYYNMLQSWLANAPEQLSKEEVDEVFKRVLKKLFKNDYKSEDEFQRAITASVRSLSTLPVKLEKESPSVGV